MPPRISLTTLIGIVAVIALGLAGMLSGSRLWLMLTSTVTLAMLLGALLASWLLSGNDRAFWVGFALFGWTYLIMGNWGWVGGQIGHDLTIGISEAAEWALPEIKGSPAIYADYMELARHRQVRIGNFVENGRMLSALCFGVLGGWLGRVLSRREERRRADKAALPG